MQSQLKQGVDLAAVVALGADTRPYYVLLGWGALGALYYVLWQRLKPAS